ncbi:glycosyltransferase family 91 protein [Penicillium riverlandense]|uniref:glycosyltransferase family 91 protein n=1 Tax=Penicillium riverlandense TaxID=1903569 RepID=UPI0025483ED6|nr:glycosyltransferase family 91 protein [Penicillium riverlandense]KAJ5815020.1 glycosyltransferase family 91 protein [Penicillium riverlandense]
MTCSAWHQANRQYPHLSPQSVEHYLTSNAGNRAGGEWKTLSLAGFQNNGELDESCDSRKRNGDIGVQKSFYPRENLTLAVQELGRYPQIERDFRNQSLPFLDFVDASWAELAGSGVWLPEQHVYLTVSRVVYYPSGNLAVPTISFLRGRVFDRHWKHLPNYTIEWNGERVTFPRFFDVPVDWKENMTFLGPEDPRVVLQEDMPGAEPVIVFNMATEQHPEENWRQAMWIHRPFSNFSAALTIRNEEPQLVEKNWAPFFLDNESQLQTPSHDLHFVYTLQPLRILRCQLYHGFCDWAFQSESPETPRQRIEDDPDSQGRMRGGTNFEPVPIPSAENKNVHLYAGFPRTHFLGGCSPNVTYRPELVVLASVGEAFHVVYASDAIDFGTAVLDGQHSPCADEARILIPNGIIHWDRRARHDLMQLVVSVADRTIEVVRIRGVLGLIVRSLPDLLQGGSWAAGGRQVVECAAQAAVRETGVP